MGLSLRRPPLPDVPHDAPRVPLRIPLRIALLALALASAPGCGHDDGGSAGPPEPVVLEVAAGDGQSALVGAMTAEPLVVRVLTPGGAAVAGARVTWSAS